MHHVVNATTDVVVGQILQLRHQQILYTQLSYYTNSTGSRH